MTADEGKFIKLQLSTLDIATSWTCEDDAIIIHDGETAAAPVLAKICGNDRNSVGDLTSSTKHLYVLFGSSGENKNGYKEKF
jgi:hypothetical protein